VKEPMSGGAVTSRASATHRLFDERRPQLIMLPRRGEHGLSRGRDGEAVVDVCESEGGLALRRFVRSPRSRRTDLVGKVSVRPLSRVHSTLTHLAPGPVDEEACAVAAIWARHGQARLILREEAREGELR